MTVHLSLSHGLTASAMYSAPTVLTLPYRHSSTSSNGPLFYVLLPSGLR